MVVVDEFFVVANAMRLFVMGNNRNMDNLLVERVELVRDDEIAVNRHNLMGVDMNEP